MPLRAPDDLAADGERILVYGGSKVGKSFAWVGIADLAHRTKADTQFWVLDTDKSAKRVINKNSAFSHLTDRVHIFNAPGGFDQVLTQTDRLLSNDINPEDFLVIDMISNVWDEMPAWWIKHVYEEDPRTYWADVRTEIIAARKEGHGHEKDFGGTSGVDWQYITKSYLDWEKDLTLNSPCHVFATAAEKKAGGPWDKTGEEEKAYAHTGGHMPRGQKQLSHRFHSVMRVQRTREGREATMWGDRDREDKWEEIGGKGRTISLKHGPKFGMDYLKKIAGWKL